MLRREKKEKKNREHVAGGVEVMRGEAGGRKTDDGRTGSHQLDRAWRAAFM